MTPEVTAIPSVEAGKILVALQAIRKGDFSVRLPMAKTSKGISAEIAKAVNDIANLSEATTDELARISIVVGREGKLTERASLSGASGSWAERIKSLNSLIESLVRPTQEVARVISAVAKGDLSQTMALKIEGRPVRGAYRQIGHVVNGMVNQLRSFSSEVTRVAREVGTEGKLGGQAQVPGAAGTWKSLTENVNRMASNLTNQVRNIAEVTTAVANGDLSKKITIDAKGEILKLKNTFNTMVDQLNSFASEVTRVAREVGTEGKLGGQARVKGIAGTWKDLTDNVNIMASNLTNQVRNIAEVTTAVAKGDLTKKITVDVKGEILKLKNTINAMVDQLGSFADEVTRVAREVGTEGKLGGQARVKGVSGTWKNLTDNVNTMASNLTNQVRNIAEVTTAVALGDLSKKITVDVRGEILDLKVTINAMVDQLNSFASEVTRVAREVGTEGKLGGQAVVKGVAGTWKDLTDNVNTMAFNLTNQVRNIAEVTTAVAQGDLTKKITVDVKGEILGLKKTINAMVDQLSSFADEVTRVAREVGTDGKLGGQAVVKGVAGTWKDLTDNVNTMASNLTNQVRNIAEVTTAVAQGNLRKKITVDVKGEILELKNTINAMVDQLSSFADEVTRVAREVGTEGKLGGQAAVKGVAGTWKDLTDNVNTMASNLTNQVRNIADVTTAVAKGDLSKKITVDVRGEILELKNTINTMVDQLSSFADEVTRVAREVGTEGKLGGQARVKGVSGTWKDLTENVNRMASNLTDQVRNIAEVTTAVAKGDLTKKITVDVRGEILELKNTINTMVDQLSSFADEVTRVAREVGTEGNLGGQAVVKGVAGTWKDLTDNVNTMASNLTDQVRNVAEVTTAVAKGDLTKKITVDVRGEILQLKNTINTMVDQLSSFADEVTRVAREVGTEGKLGGQAVVKGVAGTWKDLTDNVNTMASNLTNQVRNIVEVTTAVASGDLTKKITVDVKGEILGLKNTINAMVDQLSSFADEVTRVAREVGTEGILGGQAVVKGVAGTWKDLTESVNRMASNLTGQVRNIAEVTTAVAQGDLSKKITVDVKGEILELKNTINTMVDQLSSFADEVTRVAREVGTDGKLGGQARVKGVSGTWKDLTDNVNTMASNLTDQVRNIAGVVTAVAKGDLRRKLVLQVRGEIAELVGTINDMIDTLSTFAEQVTTVAREVGTEGKLGGQARVPGASGTWKNLTDNVNLLAANLTTQVRSIGEVATAVTQGDLTREIIVEASGEVLALRENINTMIRNLRETTLQNREQDWLKTNLARFAAMMQGQKELQTVSRLLLSELAPVVEAQHGVFYINNPEEAAPRLKLLASYAYKERKGLANEFRAGEGIVGQCAVEKQRILVKQAPADYIQISSGLGDGSPYNIIVLPILFQQEVKAVVELASFNPFTPVQISFLEQLVETLGIVLNSLEATIRTEELLRQSQALAEQLQSQQEELQQTNQELGEKAQLLAEQKAEVETKNREVEVARKSLQEKAEQLALTSKYKSEFLANMSHELRTPLNSLLILARMLADNAEGNLTGKQTEWAQTIHASGADLLGLINEILDLSKIEAGKMALELTDMRFLDLEAHLDRTFRQVADEKSLDFEIALAPELTETIYTDPKRLQQVMKNLLSNAFKFTEKGKVSVEIGSAMSGWSLEHPILNQSDQVISFTVSDTGIGIQKEKQKIIFEAFQQAEGGISRKYGGTGLGLAISREIAHMLGGEIRVESMLGEGSRFTLYLPQNFVAASAERMERVTSRPAPLSAWENPVRIMTPRVTATSVEMLDEEPQILDDRDRIKEGDRVLLIVEDDPKFAGILMDLAHEKGFKSVATTHGESTLGLVRQFRPDAITLDLQLPGISGWAVLDRLKHDSMTRHIPVHIISVEEDAQRGLRLGAVRCVKKPSNRNELARALDDLAAFVGRRTKNLLIIEDDDVQRKGIVDLIGNSDVVSTAVATAKEALEALKQMPFECVVLDLKLPDMDGFELIEKIKEDPMNTALPIIVYTGKDLTPEEETRLKKAAETIIVKGVKSPERLLDETALFLHRVEANLPETQRKIIRQIHETDPVLTDKRILIIDDDVRNIFALTSLLERYKMKVVYAETGKAGIARLKETSDIQAVLMDIMMPEMDGFEAIRRIRKVKKFEGLPIIALTAKAMKGDRERCIEAGASDYITKPVDPDQLLSLLRVWLYE